MIFKEKIMSISALNQSLNLNHEIKIKIIQYHYSSYRDDTSLFSVQDYKWKQSTLFVFFCCCWEWNYVFQK